MRIVLSLVATFLSATPALANKLIVADQPVLVAKSTLQANPAKDWNKLKANPGRNAETWTQDGELLNDLSFYAAIGDGQTLFREVDKKHRPLPRFNRTMLFTDIPILLEASYRVAREVNVFDLTESVPMTFAGRKGVSFRYSFIGPDELRRKGEARAAIVDGKLYMTTFEAPELHYFDANADAARQVMASMRITN